jgi:2'-5' RNA ligase
MRTFIALDLSPEIKARLAELLSRMTSLGGDIKWVSRESMHLTLKFLGEIDDLRAKAVEELLQNVSQKYDPMPLACRGTGSFPAGSKRPRVLWVGVEAPPALGLLEEDIEGGCEKLGFERESRPFRPHLTLGRVRSPAGIGRVVQEFGTSSETFFGEMVAGRVAFFESRLKPSGAEYRILREFPFRP